jgi:hypothetical protein
MNASAFLQDRMIPELPGWAPSPRRPEGRERIIAASLGPPGTGSAAIRGQIAAKAGTWARAVQEAGFSPD